MMKQELGFKPTAFLKPSPENYSGEVIRKYNYTSCIHNWIFLKHLTLLVQYTYGIGNMLTTVTSQHFKTIQLYT